MAPPILTLRDIHLTFGGDTLLEGIDLAVSEGERLCLVGRNGSGKSTLLKIAAGMIEADHGERFVQPGSTIRYLSQEPELSGFETALSYVEDGLAPGDDPYRAQYFLEQLGLNGTENPANLSGGEARRCALARALAPNPDILLLDEPTNHLDLPAIEWLEKELSAIRSALVIISHDRRFLEKLTNASIWLSRGKTRRLDQGFGGFENWRDGIVELEAVNQHKLDRKIIAENAWLRQGVPARRKRNQGRLRALFALREQKRSQRHAAGAVSMTQSEATQSGKLVLEAKNISKAYDGKPIIRDFSIRVQRGDRVGMVGANGAGKTTLLNILTGTLKSDAGTVRLGANLEMVSLDQNRDSLDPDVSLADALTGGHGDSVTIGNKQKHVIGYMKDFLFVPSQARTAVGALSGGERGRVMLARALAHPSNLLILDEPTNDLDIETLDLLQEMLADYAGTVLLVSHDRDFLDKVATSVIAFEGDGKWIEYAGGYTDMISQRRPIAEKERIVKPAKPKPEKATAASTAKLSYKHKYALETLPARMDEIRDEIAQLKDTLSDAELFNRDPSLFDNSIKNLQAAEAELSKSEDEWLEAEMIREEVE